MDNKQAPRQVILDFCSANEIKNYTEPSKTEALWQLLMEEKIVPISNSLWMSTKKAKEEL